MPQERKVFHGIRTQEGARVWVQTRAAMFPLSPRNDVQNHSDGFEWGYGGSGPAQLALAICLELLEGEPGGLALARRWHQDVKWRFIGTLGADVWQLEGKAVVDYVEELEARAQIAYTAGLEREEDAARRDGPAE